MRTPRWAALAVLTSLAACAGNVPPSAPAPMAEAPPPPPPPMQTPPGPTGVGSIHATRPHDGLYSGGFELMHSASQQDCPRADNDQATMRVEGGHATIDLTQGTSLTGDVTRTGRLTLVSQDGPSATATGHFTGAGFVITTGHGTCRYTGRLMKQGM